MKKLVLKLVLLFAVLMLLTASIGVAYPQSPGGDRHSDGHHGGHQQYGHNSGHQQYGYQWNWWPWGWWGQWGYGSHWSYWWR